jgi:hypothetical protein
VALAIALMAALPGCSHGQKTTPQQQYLESLKRGNAAQASQLWLKMTPADRIKFERGQGIQPAMSPKEMQQEVMRRAAEEASGQDADAGAEAPTVIAPTGGALGDLPKYLNDSSPPAASP